MLFCYTLFNGWSYVNNHIKKQSRWAVKSFWQTNSEYWCLKLASNQIVCASLCSPRFVTQFLIVLRFVTEVRKKVVIVLTPGCIGVSEYRRLVIMLLHGELD